MLINERKNMLMLLVAVARRATEKKERSQRYFRLRLAAAVHAHILFNNINGCVAFKHAPKENIATSPTLPQRSRLSADEGLRKRDRSYFVLGNCDPRWGRSDGRILEWETDEKSFPRNQVRWLELYKRHQAARSRLDRDGQ